MQTINLKEDIRSISDFRAHSTEFIAQINRNHRPIVLTQHGKSAAVLLDLDAYERLTQTEQIIQDVRISQEQAKNGDVISHEEVKNLYKRKYSK